jgi:hypothetical protein
LVIGGLFIALAAARRPAMATEAPPASETRSVPPAAVPSSAPEPQAVASASGGADVGRGSAISLQGGWWSLEAEWRSRIGVYVAAGIPWVALPLAFLSKATWAAPVGARVGYQYRLSERWSLRGSAHAAFMIDDENIAKCGCESDGGTTQRTFLFAEVGVHYQAPSGFVAGADLPVYGVRLANHPFPPPESLAFSQVYIGYSWGR